MIFCSEFPDSVTNQLLYQLSYASTRSACLVSEECLIIIAKPFCKIKGFLKKS